MASSPLKLIDLITRYREQDDDEALLFLDYILLKYLDQALFTSVRDTIPLLEPKDLEVFISYQEG